MTDRDTKTEEELRPDRPVMPAPGEPGYAEFMQRSMKNAYYRDPVMFADCAPTGGPRGED